MASESDEFGRLILEQLDSLYRVALRLTHNHAAAEDLVQETCFKAIRSRDSFRANPAGVRPWLVRILRNTFLTSLDRDSRRPVATDATTIEDLPTAAAPTVPKSKASDYMDEELVRALDAIPEEYRTVLVLWALEDFSYQEIAQALDVPIGTVMSRLHRARAKLSKELADYARREGIVRE